MVKVTADAAVAQEYFEIPTGDDIEIDVSGRDAAKLVLPAMLSEMNKRTDQELIEAGLNEREISFIRSWPEEDLPEDEREEALDAIQKMFGWE